jgi:hypothetical protein
MLHNFIGSLRVTSDVLFNLAQTFFNMFKDFITVLQALGLQLLAMTLIGSTAGSGYQFSIYPSPPALKTDYIELLFGICYQANDKAHKHRPIFLGSTD